MRKQHLVRQGKIRLFAAAGCTALAISGSFAPAANITWDNSSGDAKWFTSTNWNGDVVPTLSDSVTFPAVISGGVRTIDLTGPSSATAHDLAIDDIYTFANGTLHISNGGVTVAADKTALMNGALIPDTANGLDKFGAGMLMLTTAGASPYFASVNGGTLWLGESGIISGATVSSGADLDVAAITLSQNVTLLDGAGLFGTSSLSTAGMVTINPSASTVKLGTEQTLTIGSAPNGLTGGSSSTTTNVVGPGRVILAQPSNLITHWNINHGALQITSDAELGAIGNNLVLNGGTLIDNNSAFTSPRSIAVGDAGGTIDFLGTTGALTLTTPIIGTGTLTVSGDGRLTVDTAGARSGETVIDSAGLEVRDLRELGTGTIHLRSTSVQYFSPEVDLNSAGTLLNDISVETNRIVYIGTYGETSLNGKLQVVNNAAVININARDVTGATSTLTIGKADGDIVGGGAQTEVFINKNVNPGSGADVSIPYANPNFSSSSWDVVQGRLIIGDSQSLGSNASTVYVHPAAQLVLSNCFFDHNIELDDQARLIGTGDAASTGVINLSGANSYIGTVDAADILTVGNEPNDLTGGTLGYIIDLVGKGAVVLAHPNNCSAFWSVSSQSTLLVEATGALGSTLSGISLDNTTFFDAPQQLRIVDIGTGIGRLKAGGSNTLSVNILQKYPSGAIGKLDIADNAVVAHQTAIGTWNGSGYSDLTGLLQTGRNGGTWDGAGGIVSSDSRAASGLCAIGIASASQVLGIDSTATGTWHGQTVTGTDSLIAFTYGGDANLDGKINIDDYGRIDSNIGRSGSVFGWYNGDFNYDGKINIDDYGIIDSNIGAQGSPLGGASQSVAATGESLDVTAVPEPASMGLLLAGSLLLKRRRRGLTIC